MRLDNQFHTADVELIDHRSLSIGGRIAQTHNISLPPSIRPIKHKRGFQPSTALLVCNPPFISTCRSPRVILEQATGRRRINMASPSSPPPRASTAFAKSQRHKHSPPITTPPLDQLPGIGPNPHRAASVQPLLRLAREKRHSDWRERVAYWR